MERNDRMIGDVYDLGDELLKTATGEMKVYFCILYFRKCSGVLVLFLYRFNNDNDNICNNDNSNNNNSNNNYYYSCNYNSKYNLLLYANSVK